jgi:hypothetical protein
MQTHTWKRDFCTTDILKGLPVLYTFDWPTLQDFGVNQVLTLAQHFNKQLSTPNVNDERKQAQVMSDMNSAFQARRKTK